MKYRERDRQDARGEQSPESRFGRQDRESTWGRNRSVAYGSFSGKGPRGYFRSDERIFEEVCERMTRHGELDARVINVQVRDGEVTLTGRVQNRHGKRLAEDIADSIPGVYDVRNRLELKEKSGTPQRWTDRVGHSGVYPASDMEGAPDDSEAQGMASWGQGERGAEGYYDHGESELRIGRGDEERHE